VARKKAKRTKRTTTVLVVVDMQACFDASWSWRTFVAVGQLIKKAKRKNRPIVFLEYGSDDRTYPQLRDLVYNHDGHCCADGEETPNQYAKAVFKTKHENDGSDQVREACEAQKWATDAFEVCGVNTQACVKATVHGLSKKFPQATITLVEQACNDCCRDGQDFHWTERMKNVSVRRAA
jgi:nicotinamidase-related amidase